MKEILQNHLSFAQSRLKSLINSAAEWQKYIFEVKATDPDISGEFVLNSTLLAHNKAKLHLHIAHNQIQYLVTATAEQFTYIDQLTNAIARASTDSPAQTREALQLTIANIESLQNNITAQNTQNVKVKFADVRNLAGNMAFPSTQSTLDELAHRRTLQQLITITNTTTELTRQLQQGKKQLFDILHNHQQMKQASVAATLFAPAAASQDREVDASRLRM